MKSLVIVWMSISLMSLTGCVTVSSTGVQQNITDSAEFSADYDSVWAAIIGSLAAENLSITTLEKDSGLIALSDVRYEVSWANEGVRGSSVGAPHVIAERRANFNVFATEISPTSTRVQINTRFEMQERTGNNSIAYPYVYNWHPSYSNGRLEALIFDAIRSRL
jgi:hypothetical protein